MRIILEIIKWYTIIGTVIGMIMLRATIKFEQEIEKEIGEKIESKNVRMLILITVFTWPKKVIQFIKIITSGVTNYLVDQSREG